MKYLRWSALVTLGLALSSAILNCRDRDVSTVTGLTREAPSEAGQTAIDHCVPGQTFQCMGGCGAPGTGYQVCAADGRALGPCICPPFRTLGPIPTYPDRDDGERHIVPRGALVGGLPTAPKPDSTPSFGSGGSGGVSIAASVVGAACRSDAECSAGLGCITAGDGELSGSGPAGGYCSVACSSDAACQAIDPGSQCIGFAGKNMCARNCESRAPQGGVSKCLDRTDVMCVSVAARNVEPPGDGPQAGLCLPVCQSDAQCGPGLFCDLGSGLCSRAPGQGAPVGSPCDTAQECAGGVCLPLSDSFERVCSAFCRFGGPGCGFDASDAQPGAGCVLAQVPGEGIGDRGLCLELCQVPGDCREPGAVCLPVSAGSDTRACAVPVAPAPDAEAPGSGVAIGSECSKDADCGAGGVCLSPSSDPFGLGGGFPGGYCSVPCTNSCAAGAVCVGTSDDNRRCLKACSPGPLGGGDCGDRGELACNPFSDDPTRGFCLADCSLGGDCGERVCEPSLGLCVEGPPGGGPTEPAEPVIGNSCSTDDDCGSGFTCLTTDDDAFGLGGGFAGGYCTATCTETCAPGAVCVGPEGAGRCLRECSPAPAGDDDCGDRDELICIPFQDTPTRGFCLPDCNAGGTCGERSCDPDLGVCVAPPVPECAQDEDCLNAEVCQSGNCVAAQPPAPECSSDADCGSGTCQSGACVDAACSLDADCAEGVCDPELAACIAAPAVPIGGACSADSDCAGEICLSLDGGATQLCTAGCLFNSSVGCEAYGTDAFCALSAGLAPPDDDIGICLQLCATSADCNQPGYRCLLIPALNRSVCGP